VRNDSGLSSGMRNAEKENELEASIFALHYIVARLINRIPGRSSFKKEKDCVR